MLVNWDRPRIFRSPIHASPAKLWTMRGRGFGANGLHGFLFTCSRPGPNVGPANMEAKQQYTVYFWSVLIQLLFTSFKKKNTHLPAFTCSILHPIQHPYYSITKVSTPCHFAPTRRPCAGAPFRNLWVHNPKPVGCSQGMMWKQADSKQKLQSRCERRGKLCNFLLCKVFL